MNNFKIICSRFNEDIKWTKPFVESLLVYNKGLDTINYIPKSNIIKLPNYGREGGSYLHFIINNYDSLPDYMLFLQGNPFDHIYNQQIKRSLNEIEKISKKKKRFEYLSKHKIYLKKKEYTDIRSGIPSLKNNIINICINKQKLLQLIENLKLIGKQILELKQRVNSFDKESININEFLEFLNDENYFNSDKIGQQQRDYLMSHFEDNILDELIQHRYYFGYGALFLTSRENILRRPLSFWKDMYVNFNSIKPSAGWGLEKMWNLILNDYYEKVHWLESQNVLKTTPLDYILSNKQLFNKNIIYITKKINTKYFYYNKLFKKTILISKDNRKDVLNYYQKSYTNSINFVYYNMCKQTNLVYLGNLSKPELKNSMEILTNLYNNFFIVLDNYIKIDDYYLNDKPFHYLYYKIKDNPNFSVVGRFYNLLLCKYENLK